jgi:hypothetical protein
MSRRAEIKIRGIDATEEDLFQARRNAKAEHQRYTSTFDKRKRKTKWLLERISEGEILKLVCVAKLAPGATKIEKDSIAIIGSFIQITNYRRYPEEHNAT